MLGFVALKTPTKEQQAQKMRKLPPIAWFKAVACMSVELVSHHPSDMLFFRCCSIVTQTMDVAQVGAAVIVRLSQVGPLL